MILAVSNIICFVTTTDAVYRLENVQYGWEFPTQLLVVVIVFTYAVIWCVYS